MTITSYSFGKITIDGQTFTSDLIIYPGRIDPSWWRREGHFLQTDDLVDVFGKKPDILIIGTGYSGLMKVSHEVIDKALKMGIEIHVEPTGKAARLFNESPREKKVVAALHLTC